VTARRASRLCGHRAAMSHSGRSQAGQTRNTVQLIRSIRWCNSHGMSSRTTAPQASVHVECDRKLRLESGEN
jgi:hypothetical protein